VNKILFILVAVLAVSCSAPEPPNIVFILVDDLGWADVECNNPGSFYETPNINQLAAKGVRFTSAYAASPVCSPTRASIMTGKYPARLRITDWIPGNDPKNRILLGPQDEHQLPLEEITMAEQLKQAGYVTGFFGKWHLGDSGYFPEDQGFDLNLGGHHMGSPPGGYYSPYKNPRLADGPEGEYLPDRLTDEVIHFIKSNSEKPFLAYLAFYTVHTPIQASDRHIDYYESKAKRIEYSDTIRYISERNGITRMKQDNPAYASMVHAMDENIGRLMEELESLGITDNTWIIFTSDNGGLSTLSRPGAPTSNQPLRAGKGWCYEGGIRVPLLIAGPGISRQGAEIHFPAISNDLYLTVMDLAGIELSGAAPADGLSLLPALKDTDFIPGREDLFWHFPHYHGSTWTPGSAVRSGDWKLIRFYEEEISELYNLAGDIGESNNLIERYPDKAGELEKKLDDWLKEVDAQMPSVNSEQ
jgi:arylsulfatase A-like enzyme